MGSHPSPMFIVGWRIKELPAKFQNHKRFSIETKQMKSRGRPIGKPFEVMIIDLDDFYEADDDFILEPLIGDFIYFFLGAELEVKTKPDENDYYYKWAELEDEVFVQSLDSLKEKVLKDFIKAFGFNPGEPKLYYGMEWS